MILTSTDLEKLNRTFRQDGLDYEAVVGPTPNEIIIERLEFGGCEDQEEAVWAVLHDFARQHNAQLFGSLKAVRFTD